MNDFATCMEEAFERHGGSVTELCEYTGLDRSTIYKIRNGTRQPPNLQTVERIADFFCLSHEDRRQMRDAYHMARVGPVQYFGRQEAEAFCRNFTLEERESVGNLREMTLPDRALFVFDTPGDVAIGVRSLLLGELRRQRHCTIRIFEMVLQDATLDLLRILLEEDPTLQVEHVVAMDERQERYVAKLHRTYNFHCMERLLPLQVNYRNYHVYYHYEDIMARSSSSYVYPNTILCGDYIIALNFDHSFARIEKHRSEAERYQLWMNERILQSHPLFEVPGDLDCCERRIREELFECRKPGRVYCFHTGIPLSLAAPDQTSFPRLKEGVRDPQGLRQTYQRYLCVCQELFYREKGQIVEVFTKQGVEYFARTGYAVDMDPNVCQPVPVCRRRDLIANWMKCVNSGEMVLVDLPGSEGASPISVMSSERMAVFSLPTPNGMLRQSIVTEACVTRTLQDYMRELHGKDHMEPEIVRSYLFLLLSNLK